MTLTYLFWSAYCFGGPVYIAIKHKAWGWGLLWAVVNVLVVLYVCFMYQLVGMQ